ncbi:MAG: shikimate dehydrogenase [Candidatus Polarisedimenticolaceae bacterium]|nr:shikimate dehydrogenase [Candidatus Polarisedimenticolaceae bacterium]
MKDLYAVIGTPIQHSKSPQIHQAFAEQTGEDIHYDRILGQPEKLPLYIKAFREMRGLGLNVTVPLKEEAFQLANERSDRAERAGAVNTLILLEDGRIQGDNTDGIGLVRDLSLNHDFKFKGKRVLILGAGGAVRGVVQPLMEQGICELVIANRTVSKAETVAATFADLGLISGCGLDAITGEFDLIINGTAAGLSGELPAIPDGILAKEGWCYDMMYGDQPTPFVRWGEAQGAVESLDGLGMLVEQAAESFYLWRDVRPETAPVIQMLRG